ncbi:MAG: ATP-grasp domain-containing protein [Pseudomonadota bacterium]
MSTSEAPTAILQHADKRRLGIMGGGQLGMLLCQAAKPLGVRTAVLEPNPAGSALGFADTPIIARLDDLDAVHRLVAASDVITFELEAIPDESLAVLREAERQGRVTVRPSIETLERFKDKGIQKAWLEAEGLPTLPYLPVSDGQAPEALAGANWSLPVVQKAHRGGYDGKGVQLLRSKRDLERLWDGPSYLEPALDPVRELSVVVCRGLDGTLRPYPPVSMTFDKRYNAVLSVTSPAEAEATLVAEAERIALEAIGRLDTAGVFAVELFVDPEDQVTINEISPRVHNSGHLTLEAFEHDQFDQHVRAVMDLPLGDSQPQSPASEMLNILYDDRFKAACPTAPRIDLVSDTPLCRIYWYGKSTGQAGRKMGHITAAGTDIKTVRQVAKSALDGFSDGAKEPPPNSATGEAVGTHPTETSP